MSFDPDEFLKQTAKPSLGSRLWDLLSIPEQKSKEGFGMLAKSIPNVEPTGNTVRDIAVNTPSILGQSLAETAGKVAPGFISPVSLLTSGALKGAQLAAPYVSPIADSIAAPIGKFFESGSGLIHKTAGVLGDTIKNPAIAIGPGLDKAREIYNEVQGGEGNQIREAFKEPMTHMDLIKKAYEQAKIGTLGTDEALEARKSVDFLRKSKALPSSISQNLRDTFDSVAKQDYAGADEAFKNAVKSEALRNLGPMTSTGQPAQVRMLAQLVKPHLLPFTSPIVQGAGAAGIGLGLKGLGMATDNPLIGSAIGAAKSGYSEYQNKNFDPDEFLAQTGGK